ncbi:hypothetical protein GE09DRAFT_1220196 [Coniochaeta sp. 2T2.1]|nr:hypothetical protein GE09DRAFT_1220196 [Coniochaeta sp. 2T2.1]
MPSPSQEARELQGMAPPPAPVQQAKPPVWKPPPRFATRGPQVVKRAMPPPPPPPQPKAPGVRQTPKPQAPLPPLQLRQTIEPVLPFFSTQDFMLSSQDIRDLQETTETPSKLPGKDTSRATTTRATYNETPSRPQQAPSEPNRPAAQTRVKVPSQESTVTTVPVHRPQFPQPPRYVLRNSQPRTPVCTPGSSANPCQLSQPHPQASRLNPVLINPSLSHVAGPSQRNLRSSSLAQPETVAGAASPKPPALGQKRSGTKSPPQQSMQAVEHEPAAGPEHAPKQETLKPSSSPKKGRFFTASNEQVQLAMEKSLRTHKEEQRKREAEQRALKIEEERRARQQRALVLEAERKARERHRHEEDLEPYWEPEYYCADYGTDAVTDETTEATDDPTDDGSEYDSAEEEGRQQRRTETRDRRREEATERLNERREAAEYERDVLADFNAEHQYDADRQALQEAANELRREELRREELKAEEPKTEDLKGTVKEDPYDLDADFEELLGAEFDLVDVNPPTCSDHVKKEAKVFMASQETDYGDMDVTLEDLDDFL